MNHAMTKSILASLLIFASSANAWNYSHGLHLGGKTKTIKGYKVVCDTKPLNICNAQAVDAILKSATISKTATSNGYKVVKYAQKGMADKLAVLAFVHPKNKHIIPSFAIYSGEYFAQKGNQTLVKSNRMNTQELKQASRYKKLGNVSVYKGKGIRPDEYFDQICLSTPYAVTIMPDPEPGPNDLPDIPVTLEYNDQKKGVCMGYASVTTDEPSYLYP